ncbi:uncharacterized protein LOC131628891 [Vicia villosa]|uniref:uncharacterized protein LOC131628891 n=1 Tax=Vicia villosa TaxID=3911 RepID=UPI00273B6E5E|nr:uncharacterized protein LOC131628891 [Vicia villosa]
MVIDTPASGSVITSSAYLNCLVDIFGREFGMDLVCLPLRQLDIILGMNWLEFNRVHINYFSKTELFPEAINADELVMTAKQVNEVVEDDGTVFMLFALMNLTEKEVSSELPVVCDFLEVFPEDVNELPPEREVEFAIDLNPRTSRCRWNRIVCQHLNWLN